MRKILCVAALVLALCGSAYAGDVSSPPLTDGGVSGTLNAPQTPGEQTADAWIGTGAPAADGIIQDDTADGITTAALTLLSSVLALL